ncbi:CDP-alcohol phosphatidyltransferase family protein [Consotaella salsifontis]|uniref:Phosphatidylglycerophosphate synthase n=1 Tax=Consotaella salsifontis TaxID=1365950 RepID=A0A1T4MK89_9HYPH|nr:CDP-alcohol phosphatidyltransferase family protein [Consotaella salsifontis]SJZ67281.1 Phosphatidylglycerophosphate synthase [Consotaella salsifontis]
MLDGVLKPKIEPMLDRAASTLVLRGVSANAVTLAAFALGVLAAAAIASGLFVLGLLLLLASRLCDGLDGALARRTTPTDFGGFLDIVLDFAVYGAIPLAFAALDPARNGLPAAALICSFYANGASFLALAVMAEKRQLKTNQRGIKSLYFSTGIAEATETIAMFALACLFPAAFAALAYGFAALCVFTFAARIALAAKLLN